MFFFLVLAAATVTCAGLAVWRLFVRTGHRGFSTFFTAALAIGSLLASISSVSSILFGVHTGWVFIGPQLLGLTAVLITAAALWLAYKPWPRAIP